MFPTPDYPLRWEVPSLLSANFAQKQDFVTSSTRYRNHNVQLSDANGSQRCMVQVAICGVAASREEDTQSQ